MIFCKTNSSFISLLIFTEWREKQDGQVWQVRPCFWPSSLFISDALSDERIHSSFVFLLLCSAISACSKTKWISLLCRNDKKAEGPDEKELKKKEKQRLEKEKKELKEKQEKEKKEQKEREKRETEMKKKFQVSVVILTEEGGMKVEQRGRVSYISWHTNLSGFIPHSRKVALSSMWRLKRNLCKHCSFVGEILFFCTILSQKGTFSSILWFLKDI